MNFLQKILYAFNVFAQAFGAYRLQIGILVGIGFLSGLLEGVGVNALIPLFSFIIEGGGEKDPISRAIEGAFGFFNVDFTLKYILIFIAILFIIKAIILFIGSYIQFKIAYDYEKKTRSELFTKTFKSQWSYLLEQKTGYLEKILSAEVQRVVRLFTTISSLVLVITGLIVYLTVAVNISTSMTVIALTTGICVLIVFQPIMLKMRDLSKIFSVEVRSVAHFVNENIIGVKTVKAIAAENEVIASGNARFELLRKLELKRSLLGTIFPHFFQPFSVIFILALFAFSYKAGTFNPASFIVIVYLIQRIFSQVQSLQSHTETIFNSIPYVEHLLFYKGQVLKYKEEVGGTKSFRFTDSFSFNNVSFGYGDQEILSRTSFTVPKGSFVGLIGPSGSGKTTIVDIALRLFKPNAGDVLLDGVPAPLINLNEWRTNIGYVSQDIHLINDTVENNIRFFDDSMGHDTIIEVAKQANIYDVIEALPEKFSSIVGERGVHFSAGQRQRIVIARVLARKPQFLILDEATSALDNESEKRIQEVIENLKGKITVLAIAHRLGTVMNCDTLFVLGKGKIIEQGTPQELLADQKSYFYKTYNIRK
ncbi:MAG: ABC transporter ATP-binding protein [bacterium]|nr:ABC transporter ATP-binding protein [bacterium]